VSMHDDKIDGAALDGVATAEDLQPPPGRKA
jgi:hypothetical protein